VTQPIAVLAFWKNYDRKMYLKAAQLADELGYHSFWVPEAWGYEAFQLLTEMAIHTKNIKLGTGIVNVFSRSPGMIAMSAATLDEISEGRLILGLGTSGKRVIEGFHGRAFNKPLTQLRDVIRVTRALLRGDNLLEAGAKLNDYRPFTLAMEPSRSHIPIYVAALKQRSITSIGELADGWIPTMWPWEDLGEGHAWIAEGAAKAGRDPSEIATAPYTIVVPMAGMATEMAKGVISFYIAGMGDYYRQLLTGFGYGDECKRVIELYSDKATRHQAKDEVTVEMVEKLTVAGDPMECLERLRACGEHGVSYPIVCLPPKQPWPMQEMFLRALAPNQ
jgi:alkanesulfonate monooxygenase SsuD/methylene tetrahydromethanopterin reductase-like flavin-dependent oxidoreductase (luciferase family)